MDEVGDGPIALSRQSQYFKRKGSYNRIVAYDYAVAATLLSLESYDLVATINWTRKDKERLQHMVNAYEQEGTIVNWEDIGSQLNFTPFQCFSMHYHIRDQVLNNAVWTAAEEKQLLRLAEKYQGHYWSCIASELNTGRSAVACLQHYQQALNTDIVRVDWTEEEDLQLRQLVQIHGSGNWQAIASGLEGRSASQCLLRWRKSPLCQDRIVSGAWLEDDERALFLAALVCDAPLMSAGKRSAGELARVLDGAEEKDLLDEDASDAGDVESVGAKPKRRNYSAVSGLWTTIAKLVPGK
jgi:hypothetical protein